MSKNGDGIPIALKLASEGHIVKVYIEEEGSKTTLQGYKNPSVIGHPKMLEQYDLILFDMVGMGDEAERMKKQGRFVIAGGAFNDKLELDRAYGEKIASKLTKLSVPAGSRVNTPGAAINALKSL